ncbi:MAG TPA: hypothetical protein DDZ65_10275 [Firmicutes bacterium]|nr:hypothetical protein [Bacillota bacterium]
MRKSCRFRVLFFVLMILVLTAVQVLAEKAPGHYLDAERYTLANGLTVIVKNKPSGGQVLVNMWIRTGSYYEEDQYSGIAHFLEHMVINRGTEDIAPGDLPRAVDRIGGEQNGSTRYDTTNYYIQGGSGDLGEMLELIAEMCFRPTFAQDQIDEERPVIEEEILRGQDNAGQQLFDATMAEIFKGTNYSRSIGGTNETVGNCDSQAFRDFHGWYYLPNNMILILTGDVHSAEVMPLVKEVFGDFAAGEVPAAPEANVVIPSKPVVLKVECADLEPGTALAKMVFYIPRTKVRESAALDLLAEAYCGGSYSILKEAYASSKDISSIDCIYYEFRRAAMFMFDVSGPASKISSFERNLKTSVSRLFNQVEKSRFESAKQRLETWVAFAAETLAGMANMIGAAEINGDIEHYQKYLQAIDDLSASEVKDIAKKYIDPKSYILVIYYNPAS